MAESEHRDDILRHARLALAGGICALMLVMGIGRFVYTPILPDMIAVGGLTIAQGGVLAAANFAGYLLGALAAVFVVRRPHRIAGLRIALLVSVLTTAAMGATGNYSAWLALRLVSGLASAFALVFMSGFLIEAMAQAGRIHWAGWLYGGVGLGIAGSSLLIEGLQSLDFGWRGLWLAAGAMAAVLAVPAWRSVNHLPAPLPSSSASTGASAKRLWTVPFWLVVVAYGGFGFGYVIDATYLPTLIRSQPALSGLATLSWLIVGLAAAPSNLFWEYVVQLIGRPRAMVAAYVVQGVGVLVPILWPSAVGAVIGAVALGGTFTAITAMGLIEARTLTGDSGSRAIAVMTGSFSVGQILGPLAAAALVGADGNFLGPSLAASAVLFAGAALLLPLVGRKTA